MDVISYAKAKKAHEQLSYLSPKKLKRKHRLLFVRPSKDEVEYTLVMPEDKFKAGITMEVCGYEAFVDNADAWKNEFDIFCFQHAHIMPYTTKCTPAQVKAAAKKFMDAGVFFMWFSIAGLKLQKYAANGSMDANAADMTDLLNGLARTTQNMSALTGSFSVDSSFPSNILRSECIPSSAYLNSYTSTDPKTVFPIKATQGALTANTVAYRPGSFMIIGYGGSGGGNTTTLAAYKYINLGNFFPIILDKEKNTRLALDAAYGRRIVGLGLDCCGTTDRDAIQVIIDAFDGKPMEFGFVSKKVTPELAGWMRGFTDNQRFGIGTHTHNHFNEDSMTVTDELCVVGSDQLVKIDKPFKASLTGIKSQDDTITFTKQSTSIDSGNPGATEYAINEETTYNKASLIDGYIKFNASQIGKTVKVSYTYFDENQIMLGSITDLRNKGALTKPFIFLTGGWYSHHPNTVTIADQTDATLCSPQYFPGYAFAETISRMRVKRPLPVGNMMKHGWNDPVLDISFFKYDKNTLKTTYFPEAFKRSAEMELPHVFYLHDFMYSEKASDGLTVSSKYSSDWKKGDIASTRAYAKEFWTWLIAEFDKQNVYWSTRSKYEDRYQYINKHIWYDVTDKNGVTTVTVRNRGKETVHGITFRVPMKKFNTVKNGDVKMEYTYENELLTTWFDVYAGDTITFTVS
ncbi:hypothetical protein A374_08724 [Fictibacillus macauensis ZFHKF-1]|uniref:Uncharacterized protein n=1 Tax=Fictibacillus macauensis ZFHKF-1 TaxID=1196324 RepID=I8J2D8_9BACL|nr:hypothetical protein [Fictibacillus macauensis]EIT85906.1 hypothetical protein A374_08724 [Fictibacillus macauensis ZFHKF-1]